MNSASAGCFTTPGFLARKGYSLAMPEATVQQLADQAGYGGEIVFKYTPDEVKVYATGKPDYLTAPLIRKRLHWMIESKFERKEINRVLIYIHRRWALATSCFIFVLVGAPLAVRPQRGPRKQRVRHRAAADLGLLHHLADHQLAGRSLGLPVAVGLVYQRLRAATRRDPLAPRAD